nr:immunoglobulin light chain junction region [Macaca mulatta]
DYSCSSYATGNTYIF